MNKCIVLARIKSVSYFVAYFCSISSMMCWKIEVDYNNVSTFCRVHDVSSETAELDWTDTNSSTGLATCSQWSRPCRNCTDWLWKNFIRKSILQCIVKQFDGKLVSQYVSTPAHETLVIISSLKIFFSCLL